MASGVPAPLPGDDTELWITRAGKLPGGLGAEVGDNDETCCCCCCWGAAIAATMAQRLLCAVVAVVAGEEHDGVAGCWCCGVGLVVVGAGC